MEEYKRLLKEMINVFNELTSIASVKLESASKNRVATVEECMKKEQPIVMKLRGLEQKREQVQAKLGYEGMQFKQIVAVVNPETREELLPVYEGLSRAIQMFQEINEDVEQMIRLNLREIDKALDRQSDTIYKDKAMDYAKKSSRTDRSI